MPKKSKEPAKEKAPAKKKSSKAALIKQLDAKGIYYSPDATATQLKAILEHYKSGMFWLVRLAGNTTPELVAKGITSKKIVYALPDTDESVEILNSRKLIVLKRAATPSNNAVIICHCMGEPNGSHN
tara:strand:- start:3262 stop:3642 length:381 start_codon:yes stop_codon:yes gene_type:complete